MAATGVSHLTATVIGATGAVGKEVVLQLCNRAEWDKVIVINRREVEYSSPKIEQHVVVMDIDVLETHCAAKLGGTDALFVTMGVGAASKVNETQLKHVDVELPTAVAKGAAKAGVRHVGILTAIQADANASTTETPMFASKTRALGPLYNHCKGTVEQNMIDLKFKSIGIFRPAALIGTPHTPSLVAAVSPFFDMIVPDMWKSSDINTLAAAMVFDAETQLQKTANDEATQKIYFGKSLHDLYDEIPWEHGPKLRNEL